MVLVVAFLEYFIDDLGFLMGLALEHELLDSLESELFGVKFHFGIARVFIEFDLFEELLGESGGEDEEAHFDGVYETGGHDLLEVGVLDFVEEKGVGFVHGQTAQVLEGHGPLGLFDQ